MSRTEAAIHGGWEPGFEGGVYYYRLRTSLPSERDISRKGDVREEGRSHRRRPRGEHSSSPGPAAARHYTRPSLQEWHGLYRPQRSTDRAGEPDVSSGGHERRAQVVHGLESRHRHAVFGRLYSRHSVEPYALPLSVRHHAARHRARGVPDAGEGR